ncbi:MAG: hypothetical protein ABIH78_01460 [Candidatus Peregrinibacteria bacterium]
MKILKSKSGLILTEALVTIGMLTTGAIVSGFIVTTAVSDMLLSRNYSIARNLAVEGAEAVRGIRSTNWLREPNDPSCWLTLDPDLGCGSGQMMAGSSYIATENTNNKWALEGPMKRELNLEAGGMDEYRFYMGDLPYIHDPSGEPSPYYRGVKFTEVTDDFASFEVKLQWREGAKVRTILMPVTIFNYL